MALEKKMDKKLSSFDNDEFQMMGNSPDDSRLKKSWGYISALPSEYIIHFRNGQIKTKGQGSTCFKFLRDTVFVIPTSLKEIVFQANQLTIDNVDVRLRGMAVYRIKEPLNIYKLINFSNRSRAEEKLARMIGDMCRSTAKGLVDNMKLEECIRKRKEEIAESLKKEVTSVVADEKSGWGVEITTIDIQDIYIQDADIFNSMQMMFKSGKIRESKLTDLEIQRELDTKKLESERFVAQQRKENQIKDAEIEAEIKEHKITLARKNEEKQFELDKYRVEQAESTANYKLEQSMERERRRMVLDFEKTQKEVESQTIKNKEELQTLQKKIEIENMAGPTSIERSFLENALPKIAQSMTENMKNMTMHVFQQEGGGTPFNFLLTQLMDILKIKISSNPKNPNEK